MRTDPQQVRDRVRELNRIRIIAVPMFTLYRDVNRKNYFGVKVEDHQIRWFRANEENLKEIIENIDYIIEEGKR